MATTNVDPRGGPGDAPFWPAVLIAAVAATLVASIGGALTDLGPWYLALEKPTWQPPDWAFPVAWTLIFTLTAAAGVLTWRGAAPSARPKVVALYAVNAVLNILWSGLFFTLQRPDWALLESILLIASVLVLIFLAWRPSRLAALLLTPYAVWVSVAIALNAEVVRLNAPFGG